MFNIKLDEKSYKMSFKVLPVKIQREKTDRGKAQCPTSPIAEGDRVKGYKRKIWL